MVLHYHPEVFNLNDVQIERLFIYRCGKEKTGHFFRKDYLQNTLLFRILLRKAVCCCQSLNLTDVHIFQIQQCQPEIESVYVNFMPVLCQFYAKMTF